MSRSFVLAIAALLTAAPATAQHRLAPPAAEVEILADYEASVREVLREAFSPEVKARAVVYPSSQAEFAVGLRHSAQGDEIFFIRPSRQVWTYTLVALMRQGHAGSMSMDGSDRTDEEIARLTDGLPERPADLSLERCAAPVDEDAANALILAWRTMLEDIGPPQEPGLDGVSYEFSMPAGDRSLAGETWSPRRGSRTEKLTRIAEQMRIYCESRHPEVLREMLSLARTIAGSATQRGRR